MRIILLILFFTLPLKAQEVYILDGRSYLNNLKEYIKRTVPTDPPPKELNEKFEELKGNLPKTFNINEINSSLPAMTKLADVTCIFVSRKSMDSAELLFLKAVDSKEEYQKNSEGLKAAENKKYLSCLLGVLNPIFFTLED